MKLFNLTRRLIPHSIAMQMQAFSEEKEVEHIEVDTDWMQDCPSPPSATRLKLNGTWPYRQFWRKELNKVQRELEAGK